MRTLIACLKVLTFIILSILLVPLQMLILAVHRGKFAYTVPYIWEGAVCKIFGLKVIIDGTPHQDKQTIYIANHISYLDIPVIASVLKASFVAKADVANWPVFGFLSRMQQTAFIERSRKDISVQRYALQNMLADGKSLIIFPEGTSSDGQNVLPFKSSLFSIAYNEDKPRETLYIQPLTLVLLQANGKEIETQADRDIYAWHGEMTLSPHLWQFAKSKGATVKITFHSPYAATRYDDRKALAQKCHEDILNGLQNTLLAA